MDSSILVLGLGNILLQDEALGVLAAGRLQTQLASRPDLSGKVQVLDGGTLGLDLLTYLFDAKRVLFLDAVDAGQKPGELVRLEGEAIPAALAVKLSMHQVGLQDLLAACWFRGKLPEKMVLWGMQPDVVDWGLELTPVVSKAMPQLVENAYQELETWLS